MKVRIETTVDIDYGAYSRLMLMYGTGNVRRAVKADVEVLIDEHFRALRLLTEQNGIRDEVSSP